MSEIIETYVVDETEEKVTMGRLSKIIGIFISPVKTFQALREKKHLLIPLLMLPIFLLLSFLFSWPYTEQTMIAQYEKMNMDATTISSSMMLLKYLVPFILVGGYFFNLLIMAVIFIIVGKIAKSDMTFSSAWTMGTYISIIGMISVIVSIIFTLATNTVDQANTLTSIVSFFSDNMNGGIVYYVLKPLDIIVGWQIVLIYLGFNHYGKLSKKASVIGAGVYFVFVVVMSVISGVFAMAGAGTLG